MLKKLSELYLRGWVCESWWSAQDKLFHCRMEKIDNKGLTEVRALYEDGRTLETCLRRGIARILREDGGE